MLVYLLRSITIKMDVFLGFNLGGSSLGRSGFVVHVVGHKKYLSVIGRRLACHCPTGKPTNHVPTQS
jgi:hypothetical protein